MYESTLCLYTFTSFNIHNATTASHIIHSIHIVIYSCGEKRRCGGIPIPIYEIIGYTICAWRNESEMTFQRVSSKEKKIKSNF